MARKMKESEIEWIGEIPENWKLYRMKSCITDRTSGAWGDEAVNDDGDIICLRIADFDYSKFRFRNSSVDELTIRNYDKETIDKLLLQKGDILIEKSGGGEKTPVGRSVIFDKDYPAVYANFMDRLRCSNIIASYWLQYVFVIFYKNDYSRNYIKQTTGIQNLDLTLMLANESIPVPSKLEQLRIVAYLDMICSHIDSIIEQTRTSIEEYKKLKQAVITQAVTKGIRPNRQMKDSGVEWIGEIPSDWGLYRIANLYNERNEEGLEELPILTVSINTGISDHEVADEEKDRVFVRSEDRTKYKRVHPGDLAYNMMRAWQGAFGAVRVDGMVSPAYIVAKPKQGSLIDSRYMEALLRTPSAIEEMHRYSHGITDFRLRLYWPEFKNIKVCLPSIEEQKEIADYLDIKKTKIDELIQKKESLLAQLESYKKSLIYEYVTGKKEVSA